MYDKDEVLKLLINAQAKGELWQGVIEVLDSGYDNGYKEGYKDGYDKGHEQGEKDIADTIWKLFT
jgi:flagellar biosynthesis/type III secretory pathway protein FliH